MIEKLPEAMELALKELEAWLVVRKKRLELVLVGAVAVATYTHESRYTLDIDTATRIDAVAFVKENCAPPVDKDPWKSQFEESIRMLYELVR